MLKTKEGNIDYTTQQPYLVTLLCSIIFVKSNPVYILIKYSFNQYEIFVNNLGLRAGIFFKCFSALTCNILPSISWL